MTAFSARPERITVGRAQRWLLIGLLILAFGLRLYRLDAIDISGDEAWSITVAGWSLPQIVASDAETNPPLYHLLLHITFSLWGTTPFAIRYMSVLAGTLSLAFITVLARSIGGRTVALYTLVAAAISPFLVYYAQDARMYGPALMGAAGSLTTFAIIAGEQAAGRKTRFRFWALYVFTSLVSVFSHYYAFAVLLAESLYAIWATLSDSNFHRLRQWILAWLAMAVAFIPWLFVHIQFLGGKASNRFEEWTLEKLVEIGRRTIVAYGAGVTLPGNVAWHGWTVTLLSLVGLAYLWPKQRTRSLASLLALTVLTGIIFAWAVNPIMPFFFERYLLVGAPAFLVLVGAGLQATYRSWKPLLLLSFAALLVASALSLQRLYFDPAYDKGGYGRLMAEVDLQAHPGDIMLLNNPLQASLFDYYGTDKIPGRIIDRGRLLTEENAEALMAELTAGFSRVWLVETGNPASYDPRHRAQRWLGDHGSRGYYQNYGNGNVLHLFVLEAANTQTPVTIHAKIADQILLTAYHFSPEVTHAGETVLLTLFWQATGTPERGYTVFTHIVDPNGNVVAQMDGQPGGGTRPTNTWAVGEVVEDKYAIILPDSLTPGTYTVRVGMYLWPELTRLPVIEANAPVIDDSIELGKLGLLSR